MGSLTAQANMDAFAAGGDQAVQNIKAGVAAAIVVLGIATPGPEDIVMVAFASKYGIKIVQSGGKWVFQKGGEELTGEAAEQAARHLREHLKDPFKKAKKGASGKSGATDIPSWANGQRPYAHEDGKAFAKRILDQKYGSGKYPMGPNSEYNKIKKYGDRHFE
jgi:hypothetical protein